MKRINSGATVGLCALALFAGCSSSSYQSAKMLPQGATRVTGALSNYHASVDGDDFGEPSYEVLASHGVSDKFEIGGKFAYVSPSATGGDSTNLYTLAAIPKFSIVPDQIAVVVPVGLMMSDGDSENLYLVDPGLVYTRQLNPDFELDVTGHTLILMNDGFDESAHYAGVNLGLQLSPSGAPWAINPELGFLLPIDDDASIEGEVDYFFHFGLAFHYRFGGAAAGAAPEPMASR